MMNRCKPRALTCALVIGAGLTAVSASAQQGGRPRPRPGHTPTNLQTTLANDVGTLSDKFVGLARVMAGKYDWKPVKASVRLAMYST